VFVCIEAICVLSCSCLSQVCSRVSRVLSLALQTLSSSFLCTITFSHPKALLRFIASFLRLTIITAKCLPFTRKGMATITNRPLRMHYCTTLWTCLSQTHRPYRLHCQPPAAVDTDQKSLAQLSITQQCRTHVRTSLIPRPSLKSGKRVWCSERHFLSHGAGLYFIKNVIFAF